MSTKTAPVDVLAVIDSCTDELEKQPGCYYTDAAKLQEARAAIAELIEADKAYDTARSRYDHAFRDGPHGNLDEQRDAQHMLREAKKRRAAALARVGG